jgi:hypothetical protein
VEFGCLLSFITGYGGTFSHSTVPAHVMISTIPSTSTFLTYAILGNEYFADQHAYRLKIAFIPSSTPFSGISSTKPNSLWDPTPRPCTCHSCVQSCFRDLKTPYSAGPATTQSYRPDGPDASDRTMLPPILELAAAAVGPTFSLWQFMIMDV